MLTALAFAHFSSKLLLKEQVIIPVKKTLNNAGHIDAKLIDFSEICQKKSIEIGCFLLIVSWRSFPPKFSMKLADFSKNLPQKSFKIWLFSAKILRNRPIFLQILTFLPRNRPIFERILTFFPRNRPIFPRICPRKCRKILLFFPRNIRSPVKWFNVEGSPVMDWLYVQGIIEKFLVASCYRTRLSSTMQMSRLA